MSLDLLTLASSDICNNNEFVKDFEELTVGELVPGPARTLSVLQLRRLLEAISVLSLSSQEAHQKLAYKIAVYLLNKTDGQGAVPFVAQLVLTRLGDIPVIRQMVDSQLQDYFDYFRSPNKSEVSGEASLDSSTFFRFPEVLERKAFNQIRIGANQKLTFTNFQSAIWKYLRSGKDLALSGPTSTGKSYAIMSYIASLMAERESFCAIYIVPTKALVAEVQTSIVRGLKEFGVAPETFLVFTGSSALNPGEVRELQKKVLVLTQERLLDMLANKRVDFAIDLLVVDEAQQVANDSRGIIIEDAVQELVAHHPEMQNVIISPYVSNPERFGKIFGVESGKFEKARTTKSPVAQNIFFVSFAKQETDSKYVTDVAVLIQELQKGNKSREFLLNYDLTFERPLERFFQMKAWVAKNLTRSDEPTLIYCDRPTDCRKVASELASMFQGKIELSPALKEAINFLRYQVHSDYYLPDFLKFKVGYHYGTMPQFVRSYVRDLFDNEEITFLACTSTLLEGVNLPAKNLVLRNPRKGRKPMDTLSIRNLMGRAGRLKRDYYGKIFCIDVDEWESGKDAFEDKPELIESSSETALTKNMLELISYLRDPKYEASARVRSMSSSLLMNQLIHPDGVFLSKFKLRNDTIKDEYLDILAAMLKERTEELSLDKSVILRNRSIDPRFQNELYLVLKRHTKRPLPPFPGSDEYHLYNELAPIFEMVAQVLLRDNSPFYKKCAVIASKWLNQLTYKAILDSQISYDLRTGEAFDELSRKKQVNKTIEELDDIIENNIRYHYTRGLQCYCDILATILKEEEKSEDYCELLPLYLESGASDERILFLMGAGLSRNAAIDIYQTFGGATGLPAWSSVKDTVEWLRLNSTEIESKVHRGLYREVERLLGFAHAN